MSHCLRVVSLCALACAISAIAPIVPSAAAGRALPLHFEANRGQLAAPARFVARGAQGTLFLLPGEVVVALDSEPLRLRWRGARLDASIAGEAPLAGRVQHLHGRDPARWQRDVPTYARVRYTELYPGIDVVFYGNAGRVEHDLVVAPGADPAQAKLVLEGADSARIDERGDLVVTRAKRSVRLHAPISHQERDGRRHPVASRWLLEDERLAWIGVGDYDRSRPLLIDPVLDYASYFGGNSEDNGGGIHVDATGITFGGTTVSTDLPAAGGEQPINAGGFDAFVAKLAPDGQTLLHATYYGGSGDDTQRDLVVDAAGDAYLVGETTSTDLPTTEGAFDQSCGNDGFCGGGPDTFVAKLDGDDGSLLYATYLGGSGSDIAGKIAVDGDASAYVAGYTNSVDLPATPGAYDETCGTDGACNDVKRDCFVAKLAPDAASLVYLSYLGGSAFDRCFGVDVDESGRAAVVGSTFSADFPATPGAYDTSCGSDGACDGGDDAFAALVAADGASLVYATHLGGSGDGDAAIDEYGWAVDVDAAGRAYVVGQTDSSDFSTPGGIQTDYGGGPLDAFVAELDPTGATLSFATLLGGSGEEQGFDIAVDALGGLHVSGVTTSSGFPLVAALPGPGNACTNCEAGFTEAFVTSIDAGRTGFVFSTFLGGSSSEYGSNLTLGPDASLYLLGDTASTDFPTLAPYQGTHGVAPGGAANYDAFVARVPEPAAQAIGVWSLAALGSLRRRSGAH